MDAYRNVRACFLSVCLYVGICKGEIGRVCALVSSIVSPGCGVCPSTCSFLCHTSAVPQNNITPTGAPGAAGRALRHLHGPAPDRGALGLVRFDVCAVCVCVHADRSSVGRITKQTPTDIHMATTQLPTQIKHLNPSTIQTNPQTHQSGATSSGACRGWTSRTWPTTTTSSSAPPRSRWACSGTSPGRRASVRFGLLFGRCMRVCRVCFV